jgi:hypothetical protein
VGQVIAVITDLDMGENNDLVAAVQSQLQKRCLIAREVADPETRKARATETIQRSWK